MTPRVKSTMSTTGLDALTQAAVICASLSLIASTQGREPPAPGVTFADIVKVWKSRQDKVRSFQFSWKGEQVIGKGMLPSRQKANQSRPAKDTPTLPAADTAFTTLHRVSVDGQRMRYHYEGKIWSAQEHKLLPQVYDSAYDGKDSKLFWPEKSPVHPSGVIRQEGYNIEISNSNSLPVLLTYRACDPMVGVMSRKPFRVLDQRGMIGGRECIILEEPPRSGGRLALSLWVDPGKGFSIMRYALDRGGKRVLQVDIDYREEKTGIAPCSWTIQRLTNEGLLRGHSSAAVAEYALNIDIPLREFQIAFPPGTLVADYKTASPSGAPLEYIVREKNDKRIVTDQESRHATYEQLLSSETGNALKPSRSSWPRMILPALLGLLLLLVGWRIIQRLKRHGFFRRAS